MFIELMPLIGRRAITITVSPLPEGRIRVNVVPMALAEDSKVNDKIGYSNKDKIAQIPESAIHALTGKKCSPNESQFSAREAPLL